MFLNENKVPQHLHAAALAAPRRRVKQKRLGVRRMLENQLAASAEV
jgi:hypothetical protein